MINTDSNKGKALERLSKHLGLYEKVNQQKPMTDKAPDRWVVVRTDRELTLLEWTQKVEELNRWETEKRQHAMDLSNSPKTLEKRA